MVDDILKVVREAYNVYLERKAAKKKARDEKAALDAANNLKEQTEWAAWFNMRNRWLADRRRVSDSKDELMGGK
jgi:hypothetical protein